MTRKHVLPRATNGRDVAWDKVFMWITIGVFVAVWPLTALAFIVAMIRSLP